MFRLFGNFLALLVAIVILKWLIPTETADLANEILVKILTIIRDLLAMVPLSQ